MYSLQGLIPLLIIVILSFFLAIFLSVYIVNICYENIFARNKLLNLLEPCLRQIDLDPNHNSAFDRAITICRFSYLSSPRILLNTGCYQRILQICARNRNNLNAWELLECSIVRLNQFFIPNKSAKIAIKKTIILLGNSLFQEYDNLPIREKIVNLLYLIKKINLAETKELYDRSLQYLQKQPRDPEARNLALELGKLHYRILRKRNKINEVDYRSIHKDIRF